MAAKPIERFVKKQIQEQGGWPRILARIASGETRTAISRTLFRPDGKWIDRSTFSNMLHRWKRKAPENAAALATADSEAADAHAEASIQIMHDAPVDRDAIQKARLEADANLRYAGLIDRERWGEAKPSVNVSLNVNSLHVDALRHRVVEASKPAIVGYSQSHDGEGLALGASVSVEHVKESNGYHACETDTLSAVEETVTPGSA